MPVVATSPSSILFASTRLISLPLAATVLWKSFAAFFSRILPLVEFSVLARAAVMLLSADWVTSPLAETPSVPVATRVPRVADPAVAVKLTLWPDRL